MSTFAVTKGELYEIVKKESFQPSKKVVKLMKKMVEG